MPRYPDKDRPARIETTIPQSIKEQLDEKLKDPETGKIPVGSYKAILMDGIKRFLRRK
jgi:ribosome-binding factor A